MQGYPAHQPMFVIPGGGMVPTTMAGPGAGHPAHLIGKALVILVLSWLSIWLRASFYCQTRIQSNLLSFIKFPSLFPGSMESRNVYQFYSALLPYIHIFPSFSSASYMIDINNYLACMHSPMFCYLSPLISSFPSFRPAVPPVLCRYALFHY